MPAYEPVSDSTAPTFTGWAVADPVVTLVVEVPPPVAQPPSMASTTSAASTSATLRKRIPVPLIVGPLSSCGLG